MRRLIDCPTCSSGDVVRAPTPGELACTRCGGVFVVPGVDRLVAVGVDARQPRVLRTVAAWLLGRIAGPSVVADHPPGPTGQPRARRL